MADFSAGLQTRQGERYVILLFLLLLGEILQVFHDNCTSHSPSNCENLRGGGGVRLIGRTWYNISSVESVAWRF